MTSDLCHTFPTHVLVQGMTFASGSAYPCSNTIASPLFQLSSFALLAKCPTSPHTYLKASHHHVDPAEPRTERHSERIRFEIGLIAPFHHLFGLGKVQST